MGTSLDVMLKPSPSGPSGRAPETAGLETDAGFTRYSLRFCRSDGVNATQLPRFPPVLLWTAGEELEVSAWKFGSQVDRAQSSRNIWDPFQLPSRKDPHRIEVCVRVSRRRTHVLP